MIKKIALLSSIVSLLAIVFVLTRWFGPSRCVEASFLKSIWIQSEKFPSGRKLPRCDLLSRLSGLPIEDFELPVEFLDLIAETRQTLQSFGTELKADVQLRFEIVSHSEFALPYVKFESESKQILINQALLAHPYQFQKALIAASLGIQDPIHQEMVGTFVLAVTNEKYLPFFPTYFLESYLTRETICEWEYVSPLRRESMSMADRTAAEQQQAWSKLPLMALPICELFHRTGSVVQNEMVELGRGVLAHEMALVLAKIYQQSTLQEKILIRDAIVSNVGSIVDAIQPEDLVARDDFLANEKLWFQTVKAWAMGLGAASSTIDEILKSYVSGPDKELWAVWIYEPANGSEDPKSIVAEKVAAFWGDWRELEKTSKVRRFPFVLTENLLPSTANSREPKDRFAQAHPAGIPLKASMVLSSKGMRFGIFGCETPALRELITLADEYPATKEVIYFKTCGTVKFPWQLWRDGDYAAFLLWSKELEFIEFDLGSLRQWKTQMGRKINDATAQDHKMQKYPSLFQWSQNEDNFLVNKTVKPEAIYNVVRQYRGGFFVRN
jgi:hypothetical protein